MNAVKRYVVQSGRGAGRNVVAVLAALLMVVGVAVVTAAPSQAVGNTFLWSSSGWVAMRGLPSTDPGVVITHWEPNNIRFQTQCWTDNGGYRWFWGTAWDGNVGFVRAGNTYNQVWTPHC